jgi:hypothetical protein
MASRRELQTWSRNGFSTRWDAELAREEWDERRRAYKLRYRLRHPERLHAMQRIYKARWKAKQHGLEPPPLLDWNNVPGSFEIQFARGYLKGQRPPPLFPSCPEMKLLNLEGNTPAPRNPKENKKRTGRSSGEKKPTESIMSRPRYPEVGLTCSDNALFAGGLSVSAKAEASDAARAIFAPCNVLVRRGTCSASLWRTSS